MRNLYLFFLFALSVSLGACGYLGKLPTPSLAAQSGELPAVVLQHSGSADQPFLDADNSDTGRCDALRNALVQAQSGDTLILGLGTFDCDGKDNGAVFFPDNITVSGQGMDQTHLFTNVLSDNQGAGFEIRDGAYSDLTFENQTWDVNEDGRTIQFYDGMERTGTDAHYLLDANAQPVVEEADPGPYTATFDRVQFIGNAWVVYEWSGRGHHWVIRDSYIVSGRQGLSFMSSGGNGQYADVSNTFVDIDTSRSADIGWTSDINVGGGYGLVARMGVINVTDCTFKLKCGVTGSPESYAPRCVGVYDGNDFASTSNAATYITLTNPTFSIDGNGSTTVFDLFMTNQPVINALVITGGSGSGPGGSLTENWQ